LPPYRVLHTHPHRSCGRACLKHLYEVFGYEGMEYRCEATTKEGFIQQLACNYLTHGYFFYVTGSIPAGKDPRRVDQKLLAKYGIAISRQSRARRKKGGFANVHYLRFHCFFLMLATHGEHAFFEEEKSRIRDVRRIPIKFDDYSISVKQDSRQRRAGVQAKSARKWRVCVRVARERYLTLKAYFVDLATRQSAMMLSLQFHALPYVPYAPVRQQFLNILRLVNKARRSAGLERVSAKGFRYRRRIVKPFEQLDTTPRATTEAGLPSAIIREGEKR
jgi:hypothetical protein